MPQPHHNPGNPITLQFEQERVQAFSISALATYVLVPELKLAFDMGECLLEAVPLEHVFLSHAHGDHARCLLRHEALRRLLQMAPATYYIPHQALAGFQALCKAWHQLEGLHPPPPLPHFKPLHPGDEVRLHAQLKVKAFAVDHTLPSLGYTVYDVRKKLHPDYQGYPGHKLAELRRQGVSFEEEHQVPRLTFIGDSTIHTLYREPHVGRSRILFLEVTYLLETERALARQRGHTHLDELCEFVDTCPEVLRNQHIVLKHFSMRYDRRLILETCKNRLPAEFLKRCHILI